MTTVPAPEQLDALIVGAGFSGLYQLHRPRQLGFKVKIYEAAPALGGVWYWNRYPGARCDTYGPLYQFSLPELWQDWDFDELYPSWDKIREYFQHVDDKLELSPDIRYNTRVTQARFDEDSCRWEVDTESGPRASARHLVLCTGIGSKPHTPDIPGLADFGGRCLHTARWPQEGVDLTGLRIGVLGTGATGVQVIQEAGPVAAHITVFQRTPNMALPMRQRQLDPVHERAEVAALERPRLERVRCGEGVDHAGISWSARSRAGLAARLGWWGSLTTGGPTTGRSDPKTSASSPTAASMAAIARGP